MASDPQILCYYVQSSFNIKSSNFEEKTHAWQIRKITPQEHLTSKINSGDLSALHVGF